MALESTDLFTIYRTTDFTNYKATVSDIIDQVPLAEAPPLTAVLQTNNKSQGESIIIQDGVAGNNVIELTASLTGSNVFNNKTIFGNDVSLGITQLALLTATGNFLGVETGLLGSSTTANALRVYAAGSTIATIQSGTATVTATITNAGVATFAGALEALSVDGGVYA